MKKLLTLLILSSHNFIIHSMNETFDVRKLEDAEKNFVKNYLEPAELMKSFENGPTALMKKLLKKQTKFINARINQNDYIKLLEAAYKKYPNEAAESKKRVNDKLVTQESKRIQRFDSAILCGLLFLGGSAAAFGGIMGISNSELNSTPISPYLKTCSFLLASYLGYCSVDNFMQASVHKNWNDPLTKIKTKLKKIQPPRERLLEQSESSDDDDEI